MNSRAFGHLLVALQFGLLAALAWLCLRQLPDQLPGLLSCALWLSSLALGVWTLSVNRPGNFNIRSEPKAQGQLVMTGPYRWVRHPMYGAVLLLAAGASAWLMTLVGAVLWLDLLGVLIVKSYLEERWLLERYAAYAEYRTRTWWLVPWIY